MSGGLHVRVTVVLVVVIVRLLTEGFAEKIIKTNTFSYYLQNVNEVELQLLGSTVLTPYDTTKKTYFTPKLSPDVTVNIVLVVFATLTTVLLPLTR